MARGSGPAGDAGRARGVYIPPIVDAFSQPPTPADVSRLVLIVTGSTLEAELLDRPTAYALRQAMIVWLVEHGMVKDAREASSRVLVCSDIWYMNQEELRTCPTVSIGGPGSNALTAFLGDKLPSAYVVDGQMIVQMDPELGGGLDDVVASCWGDNSQTTAAAVGAFQEKYLHDFLEAATAGW
jgi:hypothetical protein